MPSFWVTLAVFTLTYAALAVGRIPGLRIGRPGIAMLGATLMLLTGQLPFEEAFSPASIKYDAIVLLFGLMVVVGVLRLSGAFARLLAAAAGRLSSPHALLGVVLAASGVLSAFLVNDIVCLALPPLVLGLCRRLGHDPLPHLLGVATASSIGSSATITGNPQNITIGAASHIAYARFAARLAPVAILGLVIAYLILACIYRTRLSRPPVLRHAPPPDVPASAAHSWLQFKSAATALACVVLFFALPPAALPLVALGAAAFLMLSRLTPEKLFAEVDWPLLVLFAGLFIVVRAFDAHVVRHLDVASWRWLIDSPVIALSLVSAVLSNVVSNVPAVLLFPPVIAGMEPAARETAWLALAMSSTLAGNLTVLGSIANLIVVEAARREGVEISFVEYSRAGVPITLATLAVGMAWLAWAPY